ncbi:MAG TPA: endonuclease domain-containing protein [Gemmatimonadales bacterium]|nr:endonuclease domain-containing protein [Gemmatimonadales bacterium]
MGFARYQVRRLRQEATETEKILWERLRDRRLQGLKFMRQCPIGPFVADFCCRERRIVVEVDGEGHSTGQGIARDRERDDYLRGQSYIVLRFTNEEVLADLEAVLRKIAVTTYQAPSTWHRR